MDTSRERDQSIERLLRQSLKAPQHAGAADSCLDAETLAAWVDGGLSGAALEMAQSHVADCDRCQSLVGAMVRSHVAIPEQEPARSTRWWLAWLVPLTAATAAVAIWVAVPREANVTPTSPPPAAASATSATPAPAAPAAAPVAPPSAQVLSEQDRQDQSVAQARPPQAAAPEERREAASKAEAPILQPAPELDKDTARLEADAVREEPKEQTAAGAPAAPAAAPPAAPTARAGVAGQLSANAPRAANAFAPACVPGWSAAPADVASQLTAGAAPSAAVCWLVGRGGVVVLSTDAGRTWRRVTFPEITDLSAVRATGARAASVTTADGRVFTTSDGGMTWIRP